MPIMVSFHPTPISHKIIVNEGCLWADLVQSKWKYFAAWGQLFCQLTTLFVLYVVFFPNAQSTLCTLSE